MHVRVVGAGRESDLTVAGISPDHTIADVLEAAGHRPRPTAGVDGRQLGADMPAATLYPGAEIHVDVPAAAGALVTELDGAIELHALAGPRAGHIWRLAEGRYTVGPGATIDLGGAGTAGAALDVVGGRVQWAGHILQPGQEATVGGIPIRLESVGANLDGRHGGFTFNRPPRRVPAHEPVRLVPPVPETVRGSTRHLSAIALILPAIFGIAMAVVFGRIMFLAFALMGPVMMAGHTLDDRRRRKREQRKADEQYVEALAGFRAKLSAEARAEARRRRRAAPHPSRLLSAVDAGAPGIWERRPGHGDFMVISLGTGDLGWNPVEGSDHPSEVREIVARHGRLLRAPVGVALRAGIAVGISSPADQAAPAIRAWLCSAATGHGPADMRVAILTDDAERWDWTKWLPHTTLAGGARMLAGRDDHAAAILGFLRSPSDDEPPLTLLVDDRQQETDELRPMLRDVLGGAGKPVTALVVRRRPEDLPGACTHRVDLESDAATLTPVHGPGGPVKFAPWTMAADAARHLARRLARLTDPEITSDGPLLPDQVPLTGLVGAGAIASADIVRHWANAGADHLTAPIGLGAGGRPLTIDLVADGPHALVAGTTGAGKSELLRSWIAALAMRYDADRLNFVLIDYKGGAAFDACAHLPHVVGQVTDLDEDLAARALTCLTAELRLRETWLRDAGASDLKDYVAPSPERVLPRLAIVIDEFAALAGELPDFMQALVDIAQRGRSLGVHLILATQRPAGIVNDAIRANTNLRICLRVQSLADSKDVIDSPAAARIARSLPGRGYLRLGPGELIAFQAGFAGTPAGGHERPPLRIAPFRFSMEDELPALPVPEGGPTMLDDLIAMIRRTHAGAGVSPPRRPWPDPLPVALPLAALAGQVDPNREGPIRILLGLEDRPDRQQVRARVWQPDRDGALLLAGLSGPTTAMRTIAAECARLHPDDVHLYAIDLRGHGLGLVGELPHTGAVIDAQEPDRIRRLIGRLSGEIEPRRDERSSTPTVLFIDGLAPLRSLFDDAHDRDVHDQLEHLIACGPDAAIYPVIGVNQARSIPTRLLGSIPNRLLFRMAERTDYAALGTTLRRIPDLPEGRAVAVPGDRLVHVATTADDCLTERAAAWYPVAGSAPPVRTLPRDVKLAEVEHLAAYAEGWRFPVGIRDDTLDPAVIELAPGEHLLVTGPPGSGKSTFLAALAATASRCDPTWRLLAVTPRPSSLASSPGVHRAVATVEELAAELLETRPATLLLIDDAAEVDDTVQLFEAVLSARAADCHLVAAARSDDLRRLPRHWTKRLRASRTGVVLQPLDAADGDPAGIRLGRRLPARMPPGRGYLRLGGDVVLFQSAHL